jgi:hypothetical protein
MQYRERACNNQIRRDYQVHQVGGKWHLPYDANSPGNTYQDCQAHREQDDVMPCHNISVLIIEPKIEAISGKYTICQIDSERKAKKKSR